MLKQYLNICTGTKSFTEDNYLECLEFDKKNYKFLIFNKKKKCLAFFLDLQDNRNILLCHT